MGGGGSSLEGIFKHGGALGIVVILSLSFGLASPGSGAKAATEIPASEVTPALSFTFYDFFNVAYGEWWDLRAAFYGDVPINANCFTAAAIADGLCLPSDPSLPAVASYPYTNWFWQTGSLPWSDPSNNPSIYAPYRMRVVGSAVPGYDLSQPVFLPVMNYVQAPGTRLEFNWQMNYLDLAAARAEAALGCPININAMDGFFAQSNVQLTMDLQESRRVFGVVATDAASAQQWWDANTNPDCALQGGAENNLEGWFSAMGGTPTAVGKYDIPSAFFWYYQPFYTQMSATVDADGTTHLAIDHVAWGTEVLLARMFYWGNTSYAQNYLDSTRAKGFLGMEPTSMEQLSFAGNLGASTFDFTLGAAVEYHFRHWALPGPNGVYDRTDDNPYWTWGPVLADLTDDFSPAHTISELDRYVPPVQPTVLTYPHSTVGSYNYGTALPYEYVPVRWDLAAGLSWHFQFPTGNVVLYDPNRTPIPSNPRGGFVAVSSPLALLSTRPAMYGSWDATGATWDVVGPALTGGPDGSPGSYALQSWGAISLGTGPAAVDEPPVAALSFSPARPIETEAVAFDASASYDPDGSIVAYAWDFGDGATGTGPAVAHAYAAAGSYQVTLTVRDDAGLRASTTAAVTVENRQKAVQDLIGEVDSLVASGKLTAIQGTVLKAPLYKALKDLNGGRTMAAIKDLQGFEALQNLYVTKGIVSGADAQPLLDLACRVIITLGGRC